MNPVTVSIIAGLARHALTLIGGALVAKGVVDDGTAQEITGGLMSMLGLFWSIAQKRKKGENPTIPPNLVPLLLVCLSLPFAGCVTRPVDPTQPPQPPVAAEFIALAQPLAEGFATAMIANNPRYAPVVCAVADGLALALQQTELTPEMVDAFTSDLRRAHPELDANSYALVRIFIIGTYDIWRRRYGPVIPSDPQAAEIIQKLEEVLRHTCENVTPPA